MNLGITEWVVVVEVLVVFGGVCTRKRRGQGGRQANKNPTGTKGETHQLNVERKNKKVKIFVSC